MITESAEDDISNIAPETNAGSEPVTYADVSDLAWANEQRSAITCRAVFPFIGDAPVLVGVVAHDPHAPYIGEIFARAVAGEFGEIAPFVPTAPLVPDRVSSRQFRLQLLGMGLLDTVEGWIDAQPLATQIAYQSSATFERGDAMMQAGFDALGFEPAQVDAFFVAAAGL
ncbi:hypothetical protein [Pararhodobacter sp.]|uniref:hypothetical protein n=1 Tax=Pararhodobacter sp. TaxID=2127056 RepID=UPI002AFF68B8|nr:hypothetical protein [Pararhodobacter sp.]